MQDRPFKTYREPSGSSSLSLITNNRLFNLPRALVLAGDASEAEAFGRRILLSGVWILKSGVNPGKKSLGSFLDVLLDSEATLKGVRETDACKLDIFKPKMPCRLCWMEPEGASAVMSKVEMAADARTRSRDGCRVVLRVKNHDAHCISEQIVSRIL
jgi:hypothetical protein